jgi:hypothetical protein
MNQKIQWSKIQINLNPNITIEMQKNKEEAKAATGRDFGPGS